MTKDDIIKKLRDMARYPTVTLPRDKEALSKAADLLAEQAVKLEDIEQYRMQMAGISTAAIGYWKEGNSIHPDYDTLALRDVAKLYAKYDELFQKQALAQPAAWVGLTDVEMDEFHPWKGRTWSTNELVRYVEAKLKEKNCGI